MSVKTYDPAQVSIIFAGFPIEGFADGTFIVVERRNPMWGLTIGADGPGARAKSNDKSGTITITLLQTSLSNDALSGVALADELSNDGVAPFMMKDLNGNTLLAAETAWISKVAPVEDGKEINGREWILETDDIQMLVGGNE